jgi:serine/threonine-protein kinase
MQPEKIGRYEIKSELGRGGMATVYRGYDPRFEREVAVKVLPPELLHSDPQFKLRFEREAKIIAQLEHSSIVPVYDVDTDGDQPYFVMRYMTGGSLSERIKAGVFTIEEATRILERVGPGLDEAHSKGIVHRDIKPSNILFDNRGIPYISDFGIAKLSQAQAGNVTGSAIIGTPAYMAPEQAQGEVVDGRADIYALGIILYEMVTGRQPYEADTPMAVALKHITDPVPHILTANPALPLGMDMVIQKAMAKDRDERFSSSKEMTDALYAVMRGETTKLGPVAPKTGRETVISRPVVAGKKGFNILAIVLPVIAIAAIAGGYLFLSGINGPSATEAPLNPPASAPATETPQPEPTATEEVVPPTDVATEAPVPPTDTAQPAILTIGGADKIAFVADNEIWLMNVDGSDPNPLTNDGGIKTDLQFLNDETLIFISGKTIKYVDINTGAVDILTSFPTASSLNAFRVSHDRKQVMITLNNEIFVVPFDFEEMKNISKKSELLALKFCIQPEGGTRAASPVREALWSTDDKLVAWLFRGVDAGNASVQAEQVSILDITACTPAAIDQLDNFPALRFPVEGWQNRLIPDIDWDGNDLFVFNTDRRNNGWGELYVYDWKLHKGYHINPIEDACCYRDARWSPDGRYLLFAFQDLRLGAEAPTLLYYVPYGAIGTGSRFTPIRLPEGFYKNRKEAPQPALHAP